MKGRTAPTGRYREILARIIRRTYSWLQIRQVPIVAGDETAPRLYDRVMRATSLPPLVVSLVSCLTLASLLSASKAKPYFTLHEVGPGVFAAICVPGSGAGSNAGFIIGDDGVAVVDTFQSSAAASSCSAAIRERTKLPIRFVVDTHYPLDHVAGNGVAEDAVPGHVIEVIVGIDDEADGQLGSLADRREQLLRGGARLKSVDDRDAIVADDEAGVAPCPAPGDADRGEDAGADLVQGEVGLSLIPI